MEIGGPLNSCKVKSTLRLKAAVHVHRFMASSAEEQTVKMLPVFTQISYRQKRRSLISSLTSYTHTNTHRHTLAHSKAKDIDTRPRMSFKSVNCVLVWKGFWVVGLIVFFNEI